MIEVSLADGRRLELPDMSPGQVAQTLADLLGAERELDASAVRKIRAAGAAPQPSSPEGRRPPLIGPVQAYTQDDEYGPIEVVRAVPAGGIHPSVLARSYGRSGRPWVDPVTGRIRDRWSP
jgi:hypothetical protein